MSSGGTAGPDTGGGVGRLARHQCQRSVGRRHGAAEGLGAAGCPVISNEPGGPAKVLLWDEMRIAPLLNPPNNGVVTGGTGGR
jgi:hypothetical protein